MTEIEIEGGHQLHVEEYGEGFPVLMISGLHGLAAFWDQNVVAFADHFNTLLYDHRGVGHSSREGAGNGAARATIEQMAEDAIAVLDAKGIRQAHIIGHSTGGAIAQCLALDYPGRVASLVLISSALQPDPYRRRYVQLTRRILVEMGIDAFLDFTTLGVTPPAVINATDDKLARDQAKFAASFPPIDTMVSRLDAILGFDRSADLGRVRAPTMVVACADDIVTPTCVSEALTRAIPNAELKLFPTGGHCFNRLYPREFSAAVLPFLTAHTPQDQILTDPRGITGDRMRRVG